MTELENHHFVPLNKRASIMLKKKLRPRGERWIGTLIAWIRAPVSGCMWHNTVMHVRQYSKTNNEGPLPNKFNLKPIKPLDQAYQFIWNTGDRGNR